MQRELPDRQLYFYTFLCNFVKSTAFFAYVCFDRQGTKEYAKRPAALLANMQSWHINCLFIRATPANGSRKYISQGRETPSPQRNLIYDSCHLAQEEIEAAARIASADSFIRRLPQGYDTPVTADGANLSQGQRQLIAIARAAVADPPVLILDEATSSIDTRTEALIEKGMDRLMEGRTVFVIAHRLSTVRNADAILVLEHGQVVERGSHEALLAQKGEYYQLYHGMFELS